METRAGLEPNEALEGAAAPREPRRADPEAYAEFFARAAHDLRSPLGVVLHVLRVLESDLGVAETDEQRMLFQLGGRGLRRLEAFVDRLQILSDLESGRLEVSRERLDLRDIVRRGIEGTRAAEPRSEIEVSYDSPPEPCFVDGDAKLLTRAIRELVSNAVIHARHAVRVAIEPAGADVGVSVEDDGRGVSDAARETLFQRFVVRSTRGGLGIGLSIVKDVVGSHDGRVDVGQSSLPPGRPETRGARFVVFLPVTSAE